MESGAADPVVLVLEGLGPVCCGDVLQFWSLRLGRVLLCYRRHLGVWHLELWGFQGWRNFPPAKLSPAKLSPGEIFPPPVEPVAHSALQLLTHRFPCTRAGARQQSDDKQKADVLSVEHGDQALLAAVTQQPPATTGVMLALLKANPSAASVADEEGRHALHYAGWNSAGAEVVQALLHAHAASAAVADRFELLPLHYAAHSADVKVIEALLKANPDAAAVLDSQGQYPLHTAVASRADAAAVQALLEAHPAAAGVADSVGRRPLHWAAAAAERATIATVESLLRVDPSAVEVADCEGRTPLHLAAMTVNGAEGVAQLLLKASPAAAGLSDVYGRHPLHYAAGAAGTADGPVARALLQAHEASAAVADVHGGLPLHYAFVAEAGTGADVARALLEAHPASAGAAEGYREAWRRAVTVDGGITVLRLHGFCARGVEDVRAALRPFGEIKHLHHVQGRSSETVVVFASEAAALSAFRSVSASPPTGRTPPPFQSLGHSHRRLGCWQPLTAPMSHELSSTCGLVWCVNVGLIPMSGSSCVFFCHKSRVQKKT